MIAYLLSRRWYQLSLLSLLLFTTVCAFVIHSALSRVRERIALIDRITQEGGELIYEGTAGEPDTLATNVVGVILPNTEGTTLYELHVFPRISSVRFEETRFIYGDGTIDTCGLSIPRVTPDQLRKFKKRR